MARIGRRTFLQSLSAALLAPYATGASRAFASGSTQARRLVIFFSPNGVVHRHWRPEPGLTFPAGSILEPLAPIRDDVVVIDGLDFKGATNHEGGMAAMLTGGGGPDSATQGASIDQYVAQQLNPTTRFPSLELGAATSAWGGSVQTRMSYRGAGQLVAPEDDPAGVQRRMFEELGPPSQVDRKTVRRKSVLDLLKSELTDLNNQLAGTEREKLEAHTDAIRQMERSLVTSTLPTPPPNTECGSAPELGIDPRLNDQFPAVIRAQTDLLITALACDMTRVASLQCSHTVSPVVFSWLGIGEGHHSLSHMDDGNAAGLSQLILAERWFAEQFTYLVQRLAELPEPNGEGRMLDHTLVVWAKEMGDSRMHECKSVPFVLAGQAGGCLETGRYLQYDGTPHNHLLVSLCHAMGLGNQTFGDDRYGTGPLEGLLS